ncbi:MFS general substrate transporter [Russula earlei]|uniref:MFS general substrate transporter n=1 Tax=Russula earlei TaxID=71964 RepID=A0ACC0U1Q4_9AGAM|nr:MFS general substrate transporter [Russula earlei]
MTPPSTNDNGARSQLGREDEGYEEGKVELEDSPPSPLCLYRPDIDFRLVPWLTLLYLMNFLDRGSIGNARAYEQFLLAFTVFFFPFALFEERVPSNLVLRHLRPSRWLSFIVFAWGIVSHDLTCLAIPERIDGSTGLRCLLGLAEAGLFPGILSGTRIALFFTAATMGGAFSGSLAVAIRNMDGLGGRPGWAWIFIIEGLVTILMACISPWVLQDFPETAKFLTEAERVYIVRELNEDQQLGTDEEKFKLKYLWDAGAAFPIASFMPTIINELGFSATAANLLSVPVYALACLVTCVVRLLGDRFGHREYMNLGFFGMVFLAYVILIVSRSVPLLYFAVYLAASTWILSNAEGSYKRATALAMAIALPRYRLAHGTVLAYIAVGWLSSLVYTVLLSRENKARDRGERDEVIDGKGDRWSGFRYTV